MICLIRTRVVIHQLAVPWKSTILEIFSIESTSELQTSVQGFSLASALGHSPKIFPDVREFAVQFGQFVQDDFWKCTLYGNAQ